MKNKNYELILDKLNKPTIIQNGHDAYVLIKFININSTYPIPIMLPRRNPELNYYDDIKKGIITEAFTNYIEECSNLLSKENISNWIKNTTEIATTGNSQANKFLNLLLENNAVCSKCKLTKITQNPQKPIQNLRDRGYVISTNRKKYCNNCKKNTTHYTITPVLSTDQNNYETISTTLKKRICQVFDFRDSYTGIQNPSAKSFIPDHKFPEDRWDKDTAINNNENMSTEEIKQKFQLLTTQTNLQKQRHCANCIKTGKRSYPFGIKYYYSGTEEWDKTIPKKGKDAEKGCIGCGWYDLLEWKKQLNNKLNNKN